MTTKERVRAITTNVSNRAHPVEELVGIAQCELLAEIAIQLAESNAIKRFELGLDEEMTA